MTGSGSPCAEVDLGEVTIFGGTNPPVPAFRTTTTQSEQGYTVSASFSCGAIDGAIISPAQLPLTGSTYGAVAVDADLATKEPVSACPE